MNRLYLTASVCIVMALLIPLSPSLAVAPAASPAAHFLYMFGHASFLHWLINAWSLLVLHNLLRWHRLLAAYTVAVALSFVPYAAIALQTSRPVLGLSVITTFFFGFLSPYYWRRNRSIPLMMAALVLIGCFLPGVAAAFHIVPFILGMAYWYAESAVRSFADYLR